MGGCSSSEKGPTVPAITFNMKATSDSKEFSHVSKVLSKADKIIQTLTDYTGCDEYIKEALSEPSPDTEKAAWKAVEKAVDNLYKFYKYSKTLEELLKPILQSFNTQEVNSEFEVNVVLLSKIFDFAFHFDEKKMIKPAIQNDFSYYRRVLGRMKNGKSSSAKDKKKKGKDKGKVDEDIANKMSFHFAYPTPVMKVLIDTASQSKDNEELVKGLSLIANVACNMIQNGGDLSEEDKMLLLCVMTGCIIFVDHLEENGAFKKKSPIRIYQCISLLKNYDEGSTDFLLNSLRFSTINLSGEHTLPSIKKLLS